jgi:N-carbamoyl-L-amino-acid hydrolase
VTAASADVASSFDALWAQVCSIGRSPSGGYRRFAWTASDAALREWFVGAARDRGLEVQADRNGNLWAWWIPDGQGDKPAFVTGSHLDSVPDGGAFDGPLGVVSALCAIDELKARGVRLRKPIAVAVFADEEGSRFGVACVGSRLMTGVLEPERALALSDPDGISLAEAMNASGVDVAGLGRDDQLLRRIDLIVELHIEQGRALVDRDAPVGIGTGVWPHGRWRFSLTGRADHAGTTQLDDRRDPMLCVGELVLEARRQAEQHGGLATVGRVIVEPNAVNGIPSRVSAWLDARAVDQATLDRMLIGVAERVGRRASFEQVESVLTSESLTPAIEFSSQVRSRLVACVGDETPAIGTGAGHDAAILASRVATGMLFVRNPTGISHSPEEFAERADCLAGVQALADVIEDWLRP